MLVQQCALGEGQHKVILGVSALSSFVNKTLKEAAPVCVKAKKEYKVAKANNGQTGQGQPSDHLQRPARSSRCRFCHCALLNHSAHREPLYGRVMRKKPLLPLVGVHHAVGLCGQCTNWECC